MVNDVFRMNYTELTQEQKDRVKVLKEQANVLYGHMELFVPADERSERARCMNIARTELEKAVMMAVKAITTKVE